MIGILHLIATAGLGFAVGALPVLLVHVIARWWRRRRVRQLATASETDTHVIEMPAKTFEGKDAFAAHSVRQRPDHTVTCRCATIEQLVQELQSRAAMGEGDCGLVIGLVMKADFNGSPSMKTTLWRAGSREAQFRVLHSMLRATNRDMIDDLQETKA